MNYKTLSFALAAMILFLGGLLLHDKQSFPIKYKICDISHSDCSTIARFDDMDSCKTTEEKWSWYCDTVTNPMKPDCRIEKSQISTSFCSE